MFPLQLLDATRRSTRIQTTHIGTTNQTIALRLTGSRSIQASRANMIAKHNSQMLLIIDFIGIQEKKQLMTISSGDASADLTSDVG